ncbi:hypothetical protein NUSPORA_02719 [Nucleospora cyclopteri]
MVLGKPSGYHGWYNIHLEEIFPNLFPDSKDRNVWMKGLGKQAYGVMVILTGSVSYSSSHKEECSDNITTKISAVMFEDEKPIYYILHVVYEKDGSLIKVGLQKINTWCSILDDKKLSWNVISPKDYPFLFYTRCSDNLYHLKAVEDSLSQCLMAPLPPQSLEVIKNKKN